MQTGYALTRIGGHSVHPLNAKCKKQTPQLYVILSERQRDEVLVVQQSGTDKTVPRTGIYEGVFVTFHR